MADTKDPTFVDVLYALIPKRDALHAKTDVLNAKLTEAERALVSLKLGVAARVVIESPSYEPWERVLLFVKSDKTWRLMTAIDGGAGDEYEGYMPVADAPRSVRLLAVKSLPLLAKELGKNLDLELKEVEQRIGDVERFVSGIETAKGIGTSDTAPEDVAKSKAKAVKPKDEPKAGAQ